MNKWTFLDITSHLLRRYFNIEERDENGNIILECDFEKVAPEKEIKSLSLKGQWTKDIISGDTSILDTFLKMRNPQKNQKLEYLFKDNLELAHWLVKQKNNELYLKLPIEIWEMVDKQIES